MSVPWTSLSPREWTQAEKAAAVYWHPAMERALLRFARGRHGAVALEGLNSPFWVPERPQFHTSKPTLWEMASYWHERDDPFYVDLRSPGCFACGIPGKEQDGTPEDRWCRSIGKIQRGHLVNRIRGGLDQVQNLVPLCAFCNRWMPVFNPDQAQDAINWVLEGGAATMIEEYARKREERDRLA